MTRPWQRTRSELIDLHPPGAKLNLTDLAHQIQLPCPGAFNQDRRGEIPKPNTDILRLEMV